MTKAKAKKDEVATVHVPEIKDMVDELKAVKRLLCLMLLKCGATKDEVAKTASVRLATITKMGGRVGLLLRDVNGKKD
jgi:hypothetical protein